MSVMVRGLRNPFRHRVRTAVVVALLSCVIGILAVLAQATRTARQEIERLQAGVRTVIELREAGAFGTGGFGADRPAGADTFSTATLAQIRQIPNVRHIVRIEEYIHQPQIDASKPNAYAMIIGLPPGAPLRAIGEVDYENARIVVGRGLEQADAGQEVAVVGRLYARERLGFDAQVAQPLPDASKVRVGDRELAVIGIYATGNDFGDNHVFVPIETFRAIFKPGDRLSKIRVTVDKVDYVEAVTEELKRLPGVDAVTAAEQVAAARATLGSLTAASLYGSLLLVAIGGALIVFLMVLATRERTREIGTLKALGAPNAAIATQFVAEVIAVIALSSAGAVLVAGLLGLALRPALDVNLTFDAELLLWIFLGALGFAVLGSAYAVLKAVRLSPVEAMRKI
jgi:hypothetical protein